MHSSPWETVVDLIEESGVSDAEFCASVGITVAALRDERPPLDTELCARLAAVLGPNVAFWQARERNYRARLATETP
jgi:hypothetical protein